MTSFWMTYSATMDFLGNLFYWDPTNVDLIKNKSLWNQARRQAMLVWTYDAIRPLIFGTISGFHLPKTFHPNMLMPLVFLGIYKRHLCVFA
jgi:hypothetical protein